MIYTENKIYGKVWKVTKAEKYLDLQMTTSEKNADGEYINSGWFPRCIGHAFNALKDTLKEGDRIVITKAKFTNERYTDTEGNKKSRFRFLILEAAIDDGATASGGQQTKKKATTPAAEPQTTAPASDDDCPW